MARLIPCPYCGKRSPGRTCLLHRDLWKLDYDRPVRDRDLYGIEDAAVTNGEDATPDREQDRR